VAPGNHEIDKKICAVEALEQLLDSGRITGLINIVEGAWLSEILPQFSSASFSASEISSALKLVSKPEGFTSIEGLLFPAQYSFATGTTAQTAIQSMIDLFFKREVHPTTVLDHCLFTSGRRQHRGFSQDFSSNSKPIIKGNAFAI
jgi:cell division protein YceG involved in septum cleavage